MIGQKMLSDDYTQIKGILQIKAEAYNLLHASD